ncbi:MAG: SDR family NAD(P)-dependent oxidoreductase [Spirochaetes bacterium]|jgi:NAD(P)-dependent dehydrogenase (short-subunit alcohol dehydrogenase family)|nr:SDR family NAD(P)-dependent oxidoreductase [Spirochaetota bacterium]
MTASNKPDRSVIITGGNAGLGYECARAIASSGKEYRVIIACRDAAKADDAVKKLKSETGNDGIFRMELDLASLASVRNFAKDFLKSGRPPLRALVCNAGLQVVNGTAYTSDGFEMTFGVNHLGHFLLAHLLLKQMPGPGRIIFVSSGTHDPEKVTGMPDPVYVNARALASPARDSSGESDALIGRRRYSTSKLCNIYCAYEFADRIKKETEKNIAVNAFDPGLMPGTGLARQAGPVAFFIWKYIMPVMTLLPINANTPGKSGRALAALATDALYDDATGKYFEGTKEIKSSKLSYSKENALDLWDTSVELVKLAEDETVLSV